jgi:hypothetical protein
MLLANQGTIFRKDSIRRQTLNPEPLSGEPAHETPWVDVYIKIKLMASMAEPGLNSEPQNIEFPTAEFLRMEPLRSVFFIK